MAGCVRAKVSVHTHLRSGDIGDNVTGCTKLNKPQCLLTGKCLRRHVMRSLSVKKACVHEGRRCRRKPE